MMDGFGGHGFGMGWFWILGLLILVALIWVLFNAFNQRPPRRFKESEREKTALDILKERYAKGEISKEEFEEKKKDIEKS